MSPLYKLVPDIFRESGGVNVGVLAMAGQCTVCRQHVGGRKVAKHVGHVRCDLSYDSRDLPSSFQ